MFLFLASLVALCVGPLSDRVVRRGRGLSSGLDAFILVTITGLIVGHVMPEAMRLAGWGAILAATAGLFLPRWFEGSIGKLANRAHAVALFLGVGGLFVHGLVDGAALGGADDHGGQSLSAELALAVILHRIPVGLTIWALLKRYRGRGFASLMLWLMALATTVGFFGGKTLIERSASIPLGLFEGLVAGSLLHVVLHPMAPRSGEAGGRDRFGPGLGGLAGLGLLWLLNRFHLHEVHDTTNTAAPFVDYFIALSLASAPALLIAFVGAGIVQALMPGATLSWLSRGSRFSQTMRGIAFGLPLPLCSCGVVPVYKSLATKRVGLSAGLAFLVATPELGLDAVLISLPLLGTKMTVIRIGAAVVVAFSVGMIAARFARADDASKIAKGDEEIEARPRTIGEALRVGLLDVFDATAPWIVLGIAIAALFGEELNPGWLASVPPMLRVPLFALVGVPFYVCASAATPMVAVLLTTGVSPGAALAFLLTGPATNVSTFGLLNRLHGRRLAFAFALTVFSTTTLLGWGIDAFAGPITAQSWDTVANSGNSPIRALALGALCGLLLWSLLRRGPRALMAQVLPWVESHNHDQDQDHCHASTK
ncbi:MAG: permease [Planctomycetota bacterium]